MQTVVQNHQQRVAPAKRAIEIYIENRPNKDLLTESIYDLLNFKNETLVDWFDNAHHYKETCLQILALLANPEISSRMEGLSKENAGKQLVRLVDFFNNMTFSTAHAVLDLHSLCHKMTEDEIQHIEREYL